MNAMIFKLREMAQFYISLTGDIICRAHTEAAQKISCNQFPATCAFAITLA